MVFNTASTTETLRLVGGEIATGGETAPDVSAGGLCLDQNALDTSIMTFKNSDVAHGITSQAETDTYGLFKKIQMVMEDLKLYLYLKEITHFKFKDLSQVIIQQKTQVQEHQLN